MEWIGLEISMVLHVFLPVEILQQLTLPFISRVALPQPCVKHQLFAHKGGSDAQR